MRRGRNKAGACRESPSPRVRGEGGGSRMRGKLRSDEIQRVCVKKILTANMEKTPAKP